MKKPTYIKHTIDLPIQISKEIKNIAKIEKRSISSQIAVAIEIYIQKSGDKHANPGANK